MNNKDRSVKSADSEKSVIITALDGFATKIYSLLCGGLFGRFFTSYSSDPGRIAGAVSGERKLRGKLDSARRGVARAIESSIACSLYCKLIKYLMSVKVKVYGTAIITFFMYSAAVSLFRYVMDGYDGLPVEFIRFVLLAMAAVPLVLSGTGLYKTLAASALGKKILSVTGNRAEGYETYPPCGRCNVAFLVGTVLGLATYFVPAMTVVRMLFRLIWTMAVFHSPEFGIVSLFFLMPFDTTMTLVAEVAIVVAAFILKLILGKRTVKLESVDLAALMFGFMMFVGGVFSVSASSMKPMLVYLCFMSAYFLIVCLMRSGEWLGRCLISAVSAGTAVAAYGLFQYLTGAIGFSTQWLDAEMFEGISGRAISTLENPNVLGEYLVMIIPMAAVLFLCRYDGAKNRLAALAAFGCMCCCLVVTWSRGAWLGIIFGALVFCLIWIKRILHMLWVFVLALPFLPTILPDNILARITSIGNVADSSTAYRLNIWLGTVKMLPDRILSGIGIGNGAWKLVYPHYALTGMTEAQHSHSLYFQIWVELGAIALVIFVGFLVLLFMSNFTMYKSLADAGDSIVARISPAPLKDGEDAVRRDFAKNDGKTVSRAKTTMRMNAAAPLCGVAGVLIQGFTDNIWYNYRVFLMFWLCLGLCSAYASFGRERISSGKILEHESEHNAETDITISSQGS